MDAFVKRMRQQLMSYGFTCGNERDMQEQFASFLFEEDYSYHREVRLSPRDRADFTVDVPGGIVVIEAKIKPPTIEHLRQLERYAIATCRALILLSMRPMTVPARLANLPCYNIPLLWNRL